MKHGILKIFTHSARGMGDKLDITLAQYRDLLQEKMLNLLLLFLF